MHETNYVSGGNVVAPLEDLPTHAKRDLILGIAFITGLLLIILSTIVVAITHDPQVGLLGLLGACFAFGSLIVYENVG